MKIRIDAAAIAAVRRSPQSSISGRSEMNLNQKTLETLSTAMHGEVVARKVSSICGACSPER